VPELDVWKTAITRVERGRILVRGFDLKDLIIQASFGNMVSLLLRGTSAPEDEAKMIEAILVAMADHGVHAPSTLATRIAASAGTPLQTSVAAGIAAIGDLHGGALEGAMDLLHQMVQEPNRDLRAVAVGAADQAKQAGERIPGFGHPYHSPDPRAVALRTLSDSSGISGPACEALDNLAAVLAERSSGRILPNADGAAAAILLDMSFPPRCGRGFFIIGRSAGLVAHAIEEETRERPIRTIDPDRVTYDGP
jgi:citrate synthase